MRAAPANSKKSTPFFFGFLICLTGAVCFSSKAIFVKLAYHAAPVDAITLLTLRMMFALPFYLLTALILSRRASNRRLTMQQWVRIGIAGLLGYYLSSILDFAGLEYISAGLERLILFLYPTFVLLITAVAYKAPISRIQWIALSLAYAGIGIAFIGDVQLNQGLSVLWGSALVFACAITYAFYIVVSGRIIPQVGSMKFTCYALSFAAGGVFLHYIVQYGGSFRHIAVQVYELSFYMAIIATVIPTFLMSEGIRLIGSGNAAIISSIGPVATIVQAYYFLGERINLAQIIGTVLVMVGVWLIGWKGKKGD